MKILKKRANGIVLCLFELIVGILLLINPISFTSTIIIAAGIALLVSGLASVIKYFRAGVKEASANHNLATGLVQLLAGGFCAFKSHWFIATFPVLTMIYGVAILVTGMGKIQLTVDMFRAKNKKWFWAAISAVISIACAIVVLQSPFTSTAVLWMFTGISLIVEAIFDAITCIVGGREDAAV